MRILTLLLAVLLVGAVAPQVHGQKAARVEKVKKKLRAMRAAVLVEELELDEDGAAKLMPVLDKFDDEFGRLAKEGLDLRRKLDESTDDTGLDDVIDDLVANQRARWDLDEKRFAAVRKVLTPRQAARILVVLPEIDRKILQAAKRALDAKPPKKGQGAKRRRGTGKDQALEP